MTMTLSEIAAIHNSLGHAVDAFRRGFQYLHGFPCPEFDDFTDVDDFIRRYQDILREIGAGVRTVRG